jgi:hypothetical protein
VEKGNGGEVIGELGIYATAAVKTRRARNEMTRAARE